MVFLNLQGAKELLVREDVVHVFSGQPDVLSEGTFINVAMNVHIQRQMGFRPTTVVWVE